jgi:hypothetical protein
VEAAMKSIVKALAALAFCLLVAVPSFGKLKVTLAIDVEDPSVRQSITSAVSARLNSTDRYTVVESVSGIDLLFGVLCVRAKNNNGRVIGVTCASTIEYYPFGPLAHCLGGDTMIFDAAENLRSMADALVDALINKTTDSKLREYKDGMIATIHATCDRNPSICRNP